MPRIAVLLLLAACEPHFAAKPLPPLAVEPPAKQVAAGALLVHVGEHLIWEVASDGIPIGRAELVTRENEMQSTFTTDGFAALFASVHHDLTTPIAFDEQVHSIHSALAWLRAWTPRTPGAVVLDVEYDGDAYRLACEPPIADELHEAKVMRIACEIEARDPISVTFWLSADRERLPVAMAARAGSLHLAASLVSR